MNSPTEQHELAIDDWVRIRREQQSHQTVSPLFEERVMSSLQAQKSAPKIALLPPISRPLTTSFCTTLGVTKFYFIFQLTF